MDNRIPPSPATQFMNSKSFAYYPQPHAPVTYKSFPSTRPTTPSVDAEAPKGVKKESQEKSSKIESSKEEE